MNYTLLCCFVLINILNHMQEIFSISFLVQPCLSTHCRYRGFLLDLITLSDTHTHLVEPLDEGLAYRRHLYMTTHNIHKRQAAPPHNIHTHNLRKRGVTDLRLKPHGHQDWQNKFDQ
jgi:hypothetical protein